jgi:hypothetical protein
MVGATLKINVILLYLFLQYSILYNFSGFHLNYLCTDSVAVTPKKVVNKLVVMQSVTGSCQARRYEERR